MRALALFLAMSVGGASALATESSGCAFNDESSRPRRTWSSTPAAAD